MTDAVHAWITMYDAGFVVKEPGMLITDRTAVAGRLWHDGLVTRVAVNVPDWSHRQLGPQHREWTPVLTDAPTIGALMRQLRAHLRDPGAHTYQHVEPGAPHRWYASGVDHRGQPTEGRAVMAALWRVWGQG